jgi:hypothetical protein
MKYPVFGKERWGYEIGVDFPEDRGLAPGHPDDPDSRDPDSVGD